MKFQRVPFFLWQVKWPINVQVLGTKRDKVDHLENKLCSFNKVERQNEVVKTIPNVMIFLRIGRK
jgi:hypothetical protein